MEMHLVHQSGDGEYTVVGVMLTEGAENAAYAPVRDNFPAEAGEVQTIECVTVEATSLLPGDPSCYRYAGSFTTPPSTKGVKWFVLSNPVESSGAQIVAFETLYNGNYRPVQPLNARALLDVTAAPEPLPATGGAGIPMEGLILVLGALSVAGGAYLSRRKVA